MQASDSVTDLFSQETLALDAQLYKDYIEKHIPANNNNRITYGTAGFRTKATFLPHVCLRVGIFQGILSKIEKDKALGVVVTASHNPIQDNGLKQSDFDGTMLRSEFEGYVDEFMQNADLPAAVSAFVANVRVKVPTFDLKTRGLVFIGRDTRPSSKELSDLVIKGATAVGCDYKDFGEVTTPMLHWSVSYFNGAGASQYTRDTPATDLIEKYFATFKGAFNLFFAQFAYTKRAGDVILLDASNGVGGRWVTRFVDNMSDKFDVNIINGNETPLLNDLCGAEYVHKAPPASKFPRGARDAFAGAADVKKVRPLAFDGDADRIIYYLPSEDQREAILLDGDRIITLFAYFFKKVLTRLQELANEINQAGDMVIPHKFAQWRIGMVQTGYGNGSSTKYMKDTLHVEQIFSANGVKNLHPAALQFDIGCYCESNGHGTFHVSHDKMEILQQLSEQGSALNVQDERIKEFFRLATLCYSYAATQNQVMGDAMTNFLCIEEALAYFGLTAYDWLAFYTDKKCLNSKVFVKNKSVIKVNATEDHILEPLSAQRDVDEVVQKYGSNTRAFARPSGTEDYVRVYCEADDMDVVLAMTAEIKERFERNAEIN